MENIKLKVNRTLKSLIAILLAFIMAFSILPMSIYAADGDKGVFGDFKYEIISESSKTVKIIKYNGNARDLTIPQTIGGYEVIGIGAGAFNGCKSLTTVKFPKSLKKIESKLDGVDDHRCFGGCENLKSIEFQDGIEEIGEYAFQYCTSLNSINKFPGTLKTIGDYAFANTALKELKFDGFIERINPYVFFNCNISDLIIPEGTKYIEQGAFGDCKLLENLKLPKTIDTISNYAFANCDLLTYVVVPENVYEIQDFAFSECDDLKQIYIPKSVKILGNSFFNKGYDDDKLRKSKIYYQGDKRRMGNIVIQNL